MTDITISNEEGQPVIHIMGDSALPPEPLHAAGVGSILIVGASGLTTSMRATLSRLAIMISSVGAIAVSTLDDHADAFPDFEALNAQDPVGVCLDCPAGDHRPAIFNGYQHKAPRPRNIQFSPAQRLAQKQRLKNKAKA